MAAKVTPTDTDEPPAVPPPARERVQSVPIPDGATAKLKEANDARVCPARAAFVPSQFF